MFDFQITWVFIMYLTTASLPIFSINSSDIVYREDKTTRDNQEVCILKCAEDLSFESAKKILSLKRAGISLDVYNKMNDRCDQEKNHNTIGMDVLNLLIDYRIIRTLEDLSHLLGNIGRKDIERTIKTKMNPILREALPLPPVTIPDDPNAPPPYATDDPELKIQNLQNLLDNANNEIAQKDKLCKELLKLKKASEKATQPENRSRTSHQHRQTYVHHHNDDRRPVHDRNENSSCSIL